MHSLIIIPTLVSENIDERLIPFICKLIERNIALNYRGHFQSALEKMASIYERQTMKSLGISIHGESSVVTRGSSKLRNKHLQKRLNEQFDDDIVDKILFRKTKTVLGEAGFWKSLRRFKSKGDLNFLKLKGIPPLNLTPDEEDDLKRPGFDPAKQKGKAGESKVEKIPPEEPKPGAQQQKEGQKTKRIQVVSPGSLKNVGHSAPTTSQQPSPQSEPLPSLKTTPTIKRRTGDMGPSEITQQKWKNADVETKKQLKDKTREFDEAKKVKQKMGKEDEEKEATTGETKVEKEKVSPTVQKQREPRPVILPPGRDREIESSAKSRADIEKPEVPRGIVFYDTISLEPTIAEFYVTYRVPQHIGGVLQKDDYGNFIFETRQEIFTIGLKCVPFRFRNVDDIIALMKKLATVRGLLGMTTRFVYRNYRRLFRKIPFSRARSIYHGRPGVKQRAGGRGKTSILNRSMFRNQPGDKPYLDIIYPPDYWELENIDFLAERLNPSIGTWSWSALLILTKEDFPDDFDFNTFFGNYSKLASAGWGDLVVVDKVSEILHYCSLALLNCIKIPLAYLKQLLNVKNVIDFTELSRFSSSSARPFSVGFMPSYKSVSPSSIPRVSIKKVGKVPIRTFLKNINKKNKLEK